MRDVEVEFLSSWKAKKANQNKYSLTSDEEEEFEKLVREGGNILDIMYLTSLEVINAAELYRPTEMKRFLGAVGGLAIPKEPKKKSKTSDVAKLKRKGSEDLEPAQRKKKRVGEIEVRRDKVVEFVPWPLPVELDPELRRIAVSTHGKGKALVPLPTLQNSIFDTKSSMVAKNLLNAYLSKVDHRRAKEEVLSNGGSSLVKHALEIKLRWDRDKEGCSIFPPNFNFEFVIMEEGNAKAKGAELGESQAPHPVEIHPVPSEEDQPAPPTEDQPPPAVE
ncbi:hypothetical protein SLEP1_g16098 [Rubroshorea leprosula]|uniref:Uncharacterized protein n=1 Tax=Rubroshorea leprosula TaxID=152421 RepID=A0AAV5IYZ4_9ROSI|nr:hypothetical protein SLEP1_g16098 [Rubroshorea leprosula]